MSGLSRNDNIIIYTHFPQYDEEGYHMDKPCHDKVICTEVHCTYHIMAGN